MQKLFGTCLIVIVACHAGCVGAVAKPLNASITAEPERDHDRGVLGVRYLVGMDQLHQTHIIVTNVVPGGPAEAAGLRIDDQIVAINGVDVLTMGMKSVSPSMDGAPNTVLELRVRRGARELAIHLMRGGLTRLPESDFKARMVAKGIAADRDAAIHALCALLPESVSRSVGGAIERGSWHDAQSRLSGVVHSKHGSETAEVLYALLLDRNGQTVRAQSVLGELIGRNPQSVDGLRALALTYEASGNDADAIVALKKAAVIAADAAAEAAIRAKIGELEQRSGAR